jgi:hypothetical protein
MDTESVVSKALRAVEEFLLNAVHYSLSLLYLRDFLVLKSKTLLRG